MTRSGLTRSGLAVAAVLLLLHFQVAEVRNYPVTLGLLLSGLVVAAAVRGAPPVLPFAVLAVVIGLLSLQSLLDPSSDQVQFLRSLALFTYSLGLVLWIGYGELAPRRVGPAPYLLVSAVVDALAWLQYLAGGRGNALFFNPWRQFTYLYPYNPRLGVVPVRAEAFYLEPSFAALVLVICATAAILAGARPILAVALCGFGMLAVRSASGIVTVAVLALLSIAVARRPEGARGRRRRALEPLMLAIALGGLAVAFLPYASSRLSSTGQTGSSSNYRLAAPLSLLSDLLGRTVIGEPLGSVNQAVSNAGLLLGTELGTSLDNGIYVYVYYFGWVGIIIAAAGLVALLARSLVDRPFARIAVLAVPVLVLSALFTGAVFTPEYAVLVGVVLTEGRRALASTVTAGSPAIGRTVRRVARSSGAAASRGPGASVARGGPAPLLSVVTITRNDLAGLRRTHGSIASLLGLAGVEWVVADGASNDGTPDWLGQAGASVRWASEPDDGIYDAMNRATARARGRYLWYLNAGDESVVADAPALLKRLRDEVDRPGPDRVLYGNYVLRLASGGEIVRYARQPSYLRHSLPSSHQAMVFPRAAVDSIGRYDPRFRVTGDYDLVCRLVRSGVGLVPIPVLLARFHLGGQSSRRRAELAREAAFVQRTVLGQPGTRVTGSLLRRRISFAVLTFLERPRSPHVGGDPARRRPGPPRASTPPPA